MSDQTSEDSREMSLQDSRQGFRAADVLAVLAVATFLASIGLITFFATAAFG